MIGFEEFRQRQKTIEDGLDPYKLVRADEITQIGENVFSYGNIDFKVDRPALKVLNKLCGTTDTQLSTVKDFSGESGRVNFRNYLSAASNSSKPQEIVLIAGRNEPIISNVMIIKEDFIPVETFFDFAELFIEQTDTQIEKIETNLSGSMDVMIYLRSNKPTFQSFAKDEEFETNGLFLHWNGTQIDVGNYYIRLVCTNGQTETKTHREAIAYSLKGSAVERLVNLANNKKFLNSGFERLRHKALISMNTQASLGELAYVRKNLVGHNIGLPEAVADAMIPYEENKQYFESRGVNILAEANLIKTNITIWQLYNLLTAFASHSDVIETGDIRRNAVMNLATMLLQRDFDIKIYYGYD